MLAVSFSTYKLPLPQFPATVAGKLITAFNKALDQLDTSQAITNHTIFDTAVKNAIRDQRWKSIAKPQKDAIDNLLTLVNEQKKELGFPEVALDKNYNVLSRGSGDRALRERDPINITTPDGKTSILDIGTTHTKLIKTTPVIPRALKRMDTAERDEALKALGLNPDNVIGEYFTGEDNSIIHHDETNVSVVLLDSTHPGDSEKSTPAIIFNNVHFTGSNFSREHPVLTFILGSGQTLQFSQEQRHIVLVNRLSFMQSPQRSTYPDYNFINTLSYSNAMGLEVKVFDWGEPPQINPNARYTAFDGFGNLMFSNRSFDRNEGDADHLKAGGIYLYNDSGPYIIQVNDNPTSISDTGDCLVLNSENNDLKMALRELENDLKSKIFPNKTYLFMTKDEIEIGKPLKIWNTLDRRKGKASVVILFESGRAIKLPVNSPSLAFPVETNGDGVLSVDGILDNLAERAKPANIHRKSLRLKLEQFFENPTLA